jgi:hypothetical protein
MIDRLTRGWQGVGTGPILRIVGNHRAPTMYCPANRSTSDATFICTVLVAVFANCRANHRLSYWAATTRCIYRAPDKAQGRP